MLDILADDRGLSVDMSADMSSCDQGWTAEGKRSGKRSGQACAGLKYTIGEVGFRTPPEK